jgi:hypothetical protein
MTEKTSADWRIQALVAPWQSRWLGFGVWAISYQRPATRERSTGLRGSGAAAAVGKARAVAAVSPRAKISGRTFGGLFSRGPSSRQD